MTNPTTLPAKLPADVRAMRSVVISNNLCPGCSHPLADHDDFGCVVDEDMGQELLASETVCHCLLDSHIVYAILHAWGYR